mgnify:CR=1 FL=1
MLIESFDWTTATIHPEDARAAQAIDGLRGLLSDSGYDPELGRKLVHLLEERGLAHVGADGRAAVYRGGSPATAFLRLSLESLEPALLGSEAAQADDIAAAIERLEDPDTVLVSPPLIAAWGVKPGSV